jgi:hypothetical protein
VPAVQWSDRDVIHDISKRHKKIFKILGHEFKQVFKELSLAKGSIDKLQTKDLVQLIALTRKNVDESFLELKRQSKDTINTGGAI